MGESGKERGERERERGGGGQTDRQTGRQTQDEGRALTDTKTETKI